MSVTEEIKARIDIVEYIRQYAPLKKAGRYYRALCPFHTEKTPSFIVNPDTQTWRCFGACAEGGDIFNFAQKQHGWSFPEALQELGRIAGVEVRKESPQDRQRTEHLERLRGLLKLAAETYHKWLTDGESEQARAVLAYVRDKRGLADDTIRQFELGYAPPGWQNMVDELTHIGYQEEDVVEAGLARRHEETGRVYDIFRNRLLVPIRDERGRVIGFGARALDPEESAKYINSPQTPLFDKSRVLFGLDRAKKAIRDSGMAVIVEGYLDVIQAHQAGFANVIAQMGTAMTEPQLHLIAPRYAQRIILALDADVAGQSATRRSLEVARQALESDYAGRLSVDIRILQMPDANDPDDLIRASPEKWRELVEKALSIADFVIARETQDLPPGSDVRSVSVHERMAVARHLLPILAASESNLYVESNIQKLAQRLYLNVGELLSWAKLYRSRQPATPSRRGFPQRLPPGDAAAPLRELREVLPDSGHDGPPPLDYDAVEPPEGEEAGDTASEAGAPPEAKRLVQPSTAATLSESASEGYCLRALIQHPEVYYQINRRLRELADKDARLQQGPLGGLNQRDFSRSDYSRLMEVFITAINQYDMGVFDFLVENLDPVLRRELKTLLIEENEAVRRRLGHRFDGDLAVSWKTYERRTKPTVNLNQEVLGRALQLRRERLKRELDEFCFLLMEVQQQDHQAALGIVAEVLLSKRAIQRLDVEVQHNGRPHEGLTNTP